MKFFLFAVLVFNYSISNSQKITNNIRKVETLKIYGNSKVEIGQIIINEGIQYKLYLAAIESKKDSSGKYQTTYTFTNKQNTTIYNVELEVRFEDPVIDANGKFMTGMASMGLNPDKKIFTAVSNQVLSKYFQIIVLSKKPIKAKIYGVDGKLF